MRLLAVPNVSEGRDQEAIDAIADAFFSEGVELLDVHADPDHNRSVFTLSGEPGSLSRAVLKGAHAAIEHVDLAAHEGAHPRIGAIDVAPIVYLGDEDRGTACAEALVLADLLGHELGLPVFLYGILAGGRTRSELRRGGPAALARRVSERELVPDFGPARIDQQAGAVLVAARPPLIAFNVELASPATLEQAQQIAALIREGGVEGLRGVRAIGIWLRERATAQVSMNVEHAHAANLAEVVQAIARHAPVSGAELVGVAPRAAFEGFPNDLTLRDFDSARQLID